MSIKIIAVNLPQGNHSLETFKNTFCHFNVGKIHLGKNQAFVQFKDQKDLEAFSFTNAFHKIPSLGGANFHVLESNAKWQFPPELTSTIEDLKEFQSDETQPDEENYHKQAQLEMQSSQQYPIGYQIKNRGDCLGFQNVSTINQQIKQEKLKIEQWRKSQNLEQNLEHKEAQKEQLGLTKNRQPKANEGHPFLHQKMQKLEMALNSGKTMLSQKSANVREILNSKAEMIKDYVKKPEAQKIKKIAMQNRTTLSVVGAAILLIILMQLLY